MLRRGYWVAAEGRQRTPGGGIHGAGGSVSPAGVLHAVDPETEQVLCGESLRTLIPFRDMQWSALKTGVRCHDCIHAADERAIGEDALS